MPAEIGLPAAHHSYGAPRLPPLTGKARGALTRQRTNGRMNDRSDAGNLGRHRVQAETSPVATLRRLRARIANYPSPAAGDFSGPKIQRW